MSTPENEIEATEVLTADADAVDAADVDVADTDVVDPVVEQTQVAELGRRIGRGEVRADIADTEVPVFLLGSRC